jgi:hypothetical protein
MKITTIGIDLAKSVFQVHGVDEHGKAVFNKRLKVLTPWTQGERHRDAEWTERQDLRRASASKDAQA